MSRKDSDNQPSSPVSSPSDDNEGGFNQILNDRLFAEALLDADTRFENPELPLLLRDSNHVEIISSNSWWASSLARGRIGKRVKRGDPDGDPRLPGASSENYVEIIIGERVPDGDPSLPRASSEPDDSSQRKKRKAC